MTVVDDVVVLVDTSCDVSGGVAIGSAHSFVHRAADVTRGYAIQESLARVVAAL